MKIPHKISLARLPTPLHLLSRLSEELGTRIWVKRDDLTHSVCTGNKIRKLEFIFAELMAKGCDTIITCGGVQSNHCRAVALLGAQLGVKVHLLLRGEPPARIDGNLFLDYLAGAKISYSSQAEFRTGRDELLDRIADDYIQAGRKPMITPVGGSDEFGVWGYLSAVEELIEDCRQADIEPEHIVVATGSGGTQAGLVAGQQLLSMPATIWGVLVCDSIAYFEGEIRQELLDWNQHYGMQQLIDSYPLNFFDQYIGDGYGIAGPDVVTTIRQLARNEGIILDPVYTGKAFYGMLQELKQGQLKGARDVIFIHTGGVFGLFPQKDLFVDVH